MRHTKIICTIGPSVNTVDKIIELIQAGMSVARLNFSHGTHEEHLVTIKRLKEARKKSDAPLAIMLDTKGPEIRVGKLGDEGIPVEKKERVYLVEKHTGKRKEIIINPYKALKNVKKGMSILFDNGYIISTVVEKKCDYILVEIENSGVIKSRKGVNVPDADLFLPAMVESDILDLKFGCLHGIDLVAASFIRSAAHVLEIKKLLYEESGRDIPLIAKIENKEGVANFDDILEAADGIMVARGDLGVEINLGLVPRLQKQMISKCLLAFKPVITATQMLESMITNPRPTRAEVSDVANAIYDGTSAVMLSGETAVGKYPIEVVKQMENVIIHTEDDLDYMSFFEKSSKNRYDDVSTCVAIAAVKTAYSANAKAIFVYTSSGFTARLISSLRPHQPIVALTSDEKTYHQLAFLWGVVPIYSKCKDENEAFHIMSQYAQKTKIVEFGDIVVTTTGMPFGRRGATNMMILSTVGHILVKGTKGFGKIFKGKVLIIRSPKEKNKMRGKIIVIPRCDETYLPFLNKASCIVLQNQAGDVHSEKYAMQIAKKLNISYVGRADNAMSILSDGEEVVVNPSNGLIY